MSDNNKQRSRGWCFTINNYTDDELNHLSKVGSDLNQCVYLVFGKEVSSTGTPHLQGFLYCKTKKSFKQAKGLLSDRAYVDASRGTPQEASDYCKKDGLVTEYGTCPMQGKRTDLDNVAKLVIEGASIASVAETFPTTFIKYSRGIRELKLAVTKPYLRTAHCGIWLVGEPGCGKSHYAQTNYPNAYKKAMNKWFDGYAGEKEIILEDLDCNHLAHHLKIWADKWPCTGETKGGTVHLSHDLFIISSNYEIEDLVATKKIGGQDHPDDRMIEALQRRFVVKQFRKQFIPPEVGAAGPGKWVSVMCDEHGEDHVLGELP